MSKKVHFWHGCAWADGSKYMSDTNQTYDWKKVTCYHCINNLNPNGTSRFWTTLDKQRFKELKS